MAIMAMATIHKNNKKLLIAVLSSFPLWANAGDWQFKPELTLDETYSDNVELSLNDKTSSLVSQIGVRVNEKYEDSDAGLDFNLHSVYAMYSHDSDINDDYHTLAADGFLNLGIDGLSLTGLASIENQSQSAAGNSLANIVSGDTVEVRRYSSGLRYQKSNSNLDLNLSINYSDTSSEDRIGENNGTNSSLTTKNGSAARNVFWDVSASYQDLSNNSQDRTMYQTEIKIGWITDYKFNPFIRYYDENFDGNFGSQSIESNSYGLGVRWLITPRLQLDLSYNKPVDDQLDSDGKPFDEYIDTRIFWQPTNRTSVEANYSQRFFGDSYGLKLKHRNKRLTNSISYSENVETFTRYNFTSDNLGTVDTPSEDDTFSLNRQLTWSTVFALPRTSFNLSLNGNNRENLDTKAEDQYRSVRLSVKRKVSAYSTFTVSGSYNKNDMHTRNENDLSQTQQDEYKNYAIDYSREINSRLSAVLGLSYLNRESNRTEYTYDESRIYIQVSKGF